MINKITVFYIVLIGFFAYPGFISAQDFTGGSGDGHTKSDASIFNMLDIPNSILVTDVNSTNLDGAYGISNNIIVSVEFTEAVNVTGVPRILLETGTTDRYANYTSGDGTTFLLFTYSVQAGDLSAELNYTSIDALELNGGTISNASALNARLTLPDLLDANSLNGNKDIEIDGIVPTVEITQAGGQSDPTNSSPVNFTATFSEDVQNFINTDVSLSGTATPSTVVVTGGPDIYNLAVSGMTGDGTVIVDITAAVCTDLAGNANSASTNTDNTVTFNTSNPTVEITQTSGQVDPTNSSPVNFTATFSEDVQDFINTDVSISGTASATTTVITGGPDIYNLAVSGMTTNGTVIVDIGSDVCSDAAGNLNSASTNTDNTVTYDTDKPIVEITQAIGQSDPTNSSLINFTATFSESVIGLDNADITLSGIASPTTVIVTGSGNVYNIAVSGMSTDGTVIIDILADVCSDAAGNLNMASTNTDNTVTYNTSNPTVEITQATGQTDPTNSNPINFTATFNENVTDFINTDVTIRGTAGASTSVVTGGPQVFNIAISGMSGEGAVIVDIAGGVCTDVAGNDNLASTNTDNQVIYDEIKPGVVLSSSESGTTELTNIPIFIVFSELVQGFSSDNINVSNGSVSGFTQDVQNIQWSAFINPLAPGLINVSISADVTTDFSNNGNLASNVFSIEYIEVNHPPVAQNQVFSISEDSELGTMIGTVVASDEDNDNLSFEIVSGNIDDAFSIDQANGDISLAASNILNYENISEYSLTIQIEDDGNGPESTQCMVTINIIDVEDSFEANNIFTPNDERNKYWLIKNVQNYNDFELIIRTATGQIVYKTMNYQNDWNGTYNNQVLPTGTYYFSLTSSINGKSYSGFINLIRN